MKGVKMGNRAWRSFAGLTLLSVSLAAFSACSAPGGGGDGDGDGDGDGGIGDGSGSTGKQASLTEVRETCEATQTGPALLRRMTQGEVDSSMRDIFGLAGWLGVKLSPDPTSSLGFTNDASVLVVGGNTAKELSKTAEDVATLVVEQLATVLPCSDGAADRACTEEFITKYGRRLFRRPVEADEVSRYADFQESVSGRSDYATGIQWMLTAMIQSPAMIYRSEIGVKEDGTRTLDNYEMATEMAYMLTGSTPDEALLAKADEGALSDPSVRRAEAERLLSSHPRFLDGMRNFFNEWLRFRGVLGQSREDDPNFATDISPLMVEETRFFLDTLVFGDRGTVRDLMTANFSAHTPELSAFYGWGEQSEAGFDRVERPAEYGMGILAQGSLLAGTSHQTATSPTLRGLMFSKHFLCIDPPPPPAVIPTLESTNEGKDAKTTREKYEAVHAVPGTGCGNCHLKFEPFGYPFESFDELGRKREMEVTEEGEFPLNTAVDNAPMVDGSLGTFANLEELALMVDENNDIQNCFSGLLAAYMFSGAGGTTCLAEDARTQVASGQMSIYDYMLALVEAPHFSQRK